MSTPLSPHGRGIVPVLQPTQANLPHRSSLTTISERPSVPSTTTFNDARSASVAHLNFIGQELISFDGKSLCATMMLNHWTPSRVPVCAIMITLPLSVSRPDLTRFHGWLG